MFELSFDPPEVAPRLAVLTIDQPGEKVNTFAPDALDKVEELFDAIDREAGVAAVVIISGKPESFVAGADVETFAKAQNRKEIEEFSRRGHAVLFRLASSKKPIVAAIHGACLGAGLELALACHSRICTDSPNTVLGLPEVMLGLFPGAGGVTRLPRLIGLREALDMILTGRNLRAKRARRVGLVDQVVGQEALLDAARDVAAKLASGKLKPRTGPDDDLVRVLLEGNPIGRAIVFREARKTVMRKTKGLYPGPLVALDIIEKGLSKSVEEALALEPPAFGELGAGDVSRSLVSLFLRSTRLKKKKVFDDAGNEVAGDGIERLGLLGGGFMGADIAVVAADKGIDTRIREVATEPLARGMGHVKKHFDKRARSVGAANVYKARARISGGLTLEGFETMDLVIEAVPEQLALKQDVFAELESHVRRDAILASNTSALPIGKIGEKLVHKDRLIGLHFFSPVPKMQLIEIVQAETTSPRTLATCIALTTRLGKTPIVVKDGPGFFTTRALGCYLMGALDMVHAGHTIEQVEEGARKVGWPVGPLAVLDEVGIDVGVKVSQTLAEAFPDRMQIADGVDAFLAEKRFGRKSKRGFYVYPDKGRKRPDPDVYRFFPGRPEKSPPSHPEELGERLTLIVALEAVRCLQEGIIASPDVGDIGAVFGFGYPPLRGGPFRHMRSRGLDTVVARAKTLYDRYGSVYEPPELLVELAKKGKDFPSHGGEL